MVCVSPTVHITVVLLLALTGAFRGLEAVPPVFMSSGGYEIDVPVAAPVITTEQGSRPFESTVNASSHYYLPFPGALAKVGEPGREAAIQLVRSCVESATHLNDSHAPLVKDAARLLKSLLQGSEETKRASLFGPRPGWASADDAALKRIRRMGRSGLFLGGQNFTCDKCTPHLLEACYIIGNALRCQHKTGAATTCFDAVYSLSHGLHPLSHFPSQPHPYSSVNRIKIAWDAEQFAHLVKVLDPTTTHEETRHILQQLALFAETAWRKFEENAGVGNWVALQPLTQATAHNFFNKALHVRTLQPSHPALHSNPLNPALPIADIEAQYEASELTIVDGLLTADVLDELHKFCLESTIWLDYQKRSYLGAYWSPIVANGEQPNVPIWEAPNFSGFSHPLLLHVVAALKAAFSFIEPHHLQQMWSYTYLQHMHTDTNHGASLLHTRHQCRSLTAAQHPGGRHRRPR